MSDQATIDQLRLDWQQKHLAELDVGIALEAARQHVATLEAEVAKKKALSDHAELLLIHAMRAQMREEFHNRAKLAAAGVTVCETCGNVYDPTETDGVCLVCEAETAHDIAEIDEAEADGRTVHFALVPEYTDDPDGAA